jgi:hypothetical protein
MSQAFPADVAPTVLGLTEGDELLLELSSNDSLIGEVIATEGTPPGEYLDSPGLYQFHFVASGVTFELTMRYRENANGHPNAESVSIALVEGHEWSIPIQVDIDRLANW